MWRKPRPPVLAAWLALCGALAIAGTDHAKQFAFDGVLHNDEFGSAVRWAGDVNADGYHDVVVGARYEDDGTKSEAGAARVYSGKDGTTLHTLRGENSWDWFGCSVSGAGDVNDDGYADLVVGAYGHDASNIGGRVYVYSGKDGSRLHTFSGGYREDLGWSVSGAGDVNDDGYDDVIAGAPHTYESGYNLAKAYVYSGKDGEVLHTFTAVEDDDYFGKAVSGGGDANDDGSPDLIVGAPGDQGMARVYSGKDGSTLHTLAGGSYTLYGCSVDFAGDVNADGYDDLIVGEEEGKGDAWKSGVAYVYSGKDGSTLYTLGGEVRDDFFGRSVAGAGDLDGDGHDDLIVGAPWNDYYQDRCGAAYVYSGKDGSVVRTLYGAYSSQLGASVSGAGDTNDGGRADFIVGAPRDLVPGGYPGRAYLWTSRGPSGTATIGNGGPFVNDSSVTLSLTWKDPYSTVYAMRLRNEGDAWGNWMVPVASRSWTLGGGDGEKVVEIEFKNLAEEVSPVLKRPVVLDETDPTGDLVIAAGASYTPDRLVSLALTWFDALSGVDRMRFRHVGGAWAPWVTAGPAATWELPAGDGPKTVEAESIDRAGNPSDVAADTIILDQTPPDGTLTLDGGVPFTARREVTIGIDASDALSGLTDMRLRENTELVAGDWGEWIPFAVTTPWTVAENDGPKILEAELRDGVDNVSRALTNTITLDQTAPGISTFAVNEGAPYVVSVEDLRFGILARDNPGGSGVSGVRSSFDGENTWSGWYGASDGYQTVRVAHPAADGLLTATIMARDGVANESVSAECPFYLIEREPVLAGGGGKFSGEIGSALDVDPLAVDLCRGDVLTVKVKGKAAEKGQSLELALDLVAPDGTRLFQGRYPADSRKVLVKGFAAPETGRYTLVVRRASSSGAERGTFSVSLKVKQASGNKKGKGSIAGGTEIVLDARHGSTLKATLAGEGLIAAKVTVEGPDGALDFFSKEKNGKVTILPALLDLGTGPYTIRLDGPSDVEFKWIAKPPKKAKGEIPR